MFTVVIPTLNEASHISDTLLAIPEDVEPVEVIVADGHSSDETASLATARACVVASPRGRAVQMNTGAALATGHVLVFLHADTHLPRSAFAAMRQALSNPSTEGGAFRLRFDAETQLLRFYGYCTRFPLPSICFGDRALFVRRAVFEELGGFPEMPIFEDLEMVRRLFRRGGFRFLPDTVTTSSRRFLTNGPLRQQLRNAHLWLHYVLGRDPSKLAGRYSYDPPPAR